MPSGHVRASLPTSCEGTVDLSFAQDGQNLRAIVSHGIVNSWLSKLVILDVDVVSGQPTARRELSCQSTWSCTSIFSDARLLAYAFSQTNTAGRRPDVMVWDVDQDRELVKLPGNVEV